MATPKTGTSALPAAQPMCFMIADISGCTGYLHGKDAVVEEILDWRPYDYVTDRTILDTPGGQVKLLHTIELEPTGTGTTVHFRFAAPKSNRERALLEHMGPGYGEALRSGIPALVAGLEAALAARDADRGPEPDLALPRPDEPLAGLEPLRRHR